MSYIDRLRTARASKTSVLHKFLTNYDPNSDRVYAFVEGEPDKAFYRSHLIRYLPESTANVFLYNCEGKSKVYQAYRDITDRYPNCERVLFFVDKDVDDIIGVTWPGDPRIFTTEWYSIENYVVNRDNLLRYMQDFIKIKRVDLDVNPVVTEFDEQLERFYKLILPIMAWIVVMRRRGQSPNLADVKLSELFTIEDGTIHRKANRKAIEYLSRVTQVSAKCDWRLLRHTSHELKRLTPKRYVRGKFDFWFFCSFLTCSCTGVKQIVEEGGGSFTNSAQTSGTGLLHLLAANTPTPKPLDFFISHHLRVTQGASSAKRGQVRRSVWGRITSLVRR